MMKPPGAASRRLTTSSGTQNCGLRANYRQPRMNSLARAKRARVFHRGYALPPYPTLACQCQSLAGIYRCVETALELTVDAQGAVICKRQHLRHKNRREA